MTSLPPSPLPNTFDSAALLAKAQRYCEVMLSHDRSEWQFAILSSMALELLARAALARVSPVLLADAEGKDNWDHIYYALGYTPKTPKFSPRSITMEQVRRRLRDIVPGFDKEADEFCSVHVGRRNAELHSGELPFEEVPTTEWLPQFYRCCDVLMRFLRLALSDLLGDTEAKLADQMIAAAADLAAKSVLGDIRAHQTVWERKEPSEQTKASAQASIWATRQIGHVVKCPACKSDALLVGDPVGNPRKTIDGDEITEVQMMLPTSFRCLACNLRIAGLARLGAASLGSTYNRTIRYDAAEHYGSPADYDPEPDNNEPY